MRQLLEFSFPSGHGQSVAIVGRRVDELAERLGLTVEIWEEDGLGPARGFALELPSGRLAALLELEHAVAQLGAHGPEVQADLGDVAAGALSSVLEEALGVFGLDEADLQWRVDEGLARTSAAEMIAELRNR